MINTVSRVLASWCIVFAQFAIASDSPQAFYIRTEQVNGPPRMEVACKGDERRSPLSADESGIKVILDSLGSDDLAVAYLKAPDIYMWWVRLLGSISLASLGTASHETSHFLIRQVRTCKDNASLFVFDGKEYLLNIERGSTPNYSILISEWPTSWMRGQINDRFTRYVVGAKNSQGNDLYVLMDELAAYAAGASLEVALLDKYSREALLRDAPAQAKLDGQLGGAIDFSAYFAYYLMAIRRYEPNLYLRMLNDSGFVDLACASLMKIERALSIYSNLAPGQRDIISINDEVFRDVQSGRAAEALAKLKCQS
jgi:hypothetical protein